MPCWIVILFDFCSFLMFNLGTILASNSTSNRFHFHRSTYLWQLFQTVRSPCEAKHGMSTPPVLRYARHHGLTHPQPTSALYDEIRQLDQFKVDNSTDLKALLPSSTIETLDVSPATIQYLAKAIERPKQPFLITDVVPGSEQHQALKLKLPEVAFDHVTDMQWFRRGVNLANIISQLGDVYPPTSKRYDDLRVCIEEATQGPEEHRGDRVQSRVQELEYLMKSITDPLTREDWEELDMHKFAPREVNFS
jgi:hypothetical protein